MTNAPIKTSHAAIASIKNLCSALDIGIDELEFALGIPNAEKYTRIEIPKNDGTFRVVYNPARQVRRIQRRINNSRYKLTSAIIHARVGAAASHPESLNGGLVINALAPLT
ncbi:hypothetical protein [Bordetella sp. LUAb4]|uniref:hypothetical protein n=1 Tax=Bordetella sp. LUAb4 TaxID=2843195 RepID=UPI001E5EB11A|nr:hypothetical protein [Bordetella sp. LUAb4]